MTTQGPSRPLFVSASALTSSVSPRLPSTSFQELPSRHAVAALPAKSLDYDTPLPPKLPHTLPVFSEQPLELIEVLRRQSPQQLSELMGISDKLAALNVARYEAFSPRFRATNARQALLAFNGDVYEGLQARSLDAKDLDWAQQHLAILSGLYGVLRPLDRMQPYRLEMGTRLETAHGSNLYQFWGSRIAEHLNQRAARQPAGERVIVNLASQEYFKSVDLKHLKPRWWNAHSRITRTAPTRSSASMPNVRAG